MSKGASTTAFALALLVVMAFGGLLVRLGRANPKFPGADITFNSPQTNRNYTTGLLVLNFSIWTINDYNNGTRRAWYSLDGEGEVSVPLVCEGTGSAMGYPWSTVSGVTDLPALSEGAHDVAVSIEYDFGDFVLKDGSVVTFRVEGVMPKPSVPEFTMRLLPSSPEENRTTVELTIANQPFDSDNVYNYSFVYNVRIRSDGGDWISLYNAEDGYPAQSNSDQTVLSYVLGESAYYPSADYPLSPSVKVGILPTEGQVDFQVEAMIGYRDRGAYSNGMMPYVFKGQRSGWSSTETLTIPAFTPESGSCAEPFPILTVAVTVVFATFVAVAGLVYRKTRQR